MTKEEIEKKIKVLEDAKFYLDMKDHWGIDDYTTHNKYVSNIKKLKEMLVKGGN